MKILVTNDDGIHCEGIKVLAEELRKDHESGSSPPTETDRARAIP
ncbi:MAG: hypothetical protein MZU95_08505 [Desulfomicrobium escambiense]|nr:hypothetical protein [Desulfomicrobium escambiense]